jgi:hypothetical protein
MKKLILLAIFSFTFLSCEKEKYTCYCQKTTSSDVYTFEGDFDYINSIEKSMNDTAANGPYNCQIYKTPRIKNK